MSDRPPVDLPKLAAQVEAIRLNLIAQGFVAKEKRETQPTEKEAATEYVR